MMHHADDRNTLDFGFRKDVESPLLCCSVQTAGGFRVGSVLSVLTTVDTEDPEIVRRLRNITQ